MRRLVLLAVLAGSLPAAAASPNESNAERPVEVIVRDEAVAEIDDRIFGQFLERHGHEIGPEAALVPGTHQLRPDVVGILEQMAIPVVRFPGGSAVEFGEPWTELIDHAPGRKEPFRGDGTRFGFHEFLTLSEQLGWEPFFVVAMGTGLMPWKETSVDETVGRAAAQVAYFNAPLANDLPDHLKIWPELRAKNGHPEPYGVRYWQLGNESMVAIHNTLRKQGRSDEEIAAIYLDHLRRHLDAMRAVDPEIEILAEIEIAKDVPSVPLIDRMMEAFPDAFQYLTWHLYRSWGVKEILRDGQPFPGEDFTFEDFHYAFASAPDIDPETGLSRIWFAELDAARKTGIPVAVTEWNINHWWAIRGLPEGTHLPESLWVKGLGTASFLHAFFREADLIKLATQSMLVGEEWEIAAVAVEPDKPEFLLWRPSGEVSSFYRNHHGRELLATTIRHNPTYRQPFQLHNLGPAEKVAFIDPVVTRTDETLFLHVINRDHANARSVRFDLSALSPDIESAIQRELNGPFVNEALAGNEPRGATRTERPIDLASAYDSSKQTLEIECAPHSVNIVELRTAPR